jgi:AcrR family transcriptional regulator
MDETRGKILDATRALLVAAGPTGVTMRAVAERVGVTATALYRHFSDKDSLLAEVVQEDARIVARYLFPALEERDAENRLRLTVEGYLRFADDQPTLYAALMDADGTSGFPASLGRQREALYRFVLDRVREVVADESARASPEEVARFLWTYLHGAATLPGSREHRAPEVKTALRAVWLLTKGSAPRKVEQVTMLT